MRSVKSNFIWNTSYQVVRILTPLITMPYLSRVLGSEALGTYSYTYTIAMYFTFFCLLGLNQYGNREIAKVRSDETNLQKTFWSIFMLQLVMGLLVTAVYITYVSLVGDDLRPYALSWSLWVFAEVLDIGWFFYGMEEFKAITIRNLIVRLFVIFGIFLFVKTDSDLGVYCWLQAIAFALNSIVLWVLLRGRVPFARPSFRDVIHHLKPNLILFAPVIAISCYTQLNKIILGSACDMNQVAFFDNADKIVTIPLTIIQSLGTVMLPRMSNVIASGDDEAASKYLSATSWFSQAIAFGLMFGISGISLEFVPLFFGPGFEKCSILMSVLSLIIPACAWSNVIGIQYLIPHERDRQYLFSVLAGAITSLGLCGLLAQSLGAIGAAVATVSAEYVVAIIQTFFAKELPCRQYLIEALPFFCVGLVEFAAVRIIGNVWGSAVLSVALQVIVGVAVYVVLSFVWLRLRKDDHINLILPPR